jgi:hypothetical protein
MFFGVTNQRLFGLPGGRGTFPGPGVLGRGVFGRTTGGVGLAAGTFKLGRPGWAGRKFLASLATPAPNSALLSLFLPLSFPGTDLLCIKEPLLAALLMLTPGFGPASPPTSALFFPVDFSITGIFSFDAVPS